jgi:hypothetical protein
MCSIDALTLTSKLTLSKLNTKNIVGHEIHEQILLLHYFVITILLLMKN